MTATATTMAVKTIGITIAICTSSLMPSIIGCIYLFIFFFFGMESPF
jgi:hypothetical protein